MPVDVLRTPTDESLLRTVTAIVVPARTAWLVNAMSVPFEFTRSTVTVNGSSAESVVRFAIRPFMRAATGAIVTLPVSPVKFGAVSVMSAVPVDPATV